MNNKTNKDRIRSWAEHFKVANTRNVHGVCYALRRILWAKFNGQLFRYRIIKIGQVFNFK